MTADMHVHTHFSCDAKPTMEEYCRSARDKRIDAICFTDHVDFNPNDYGCGLYRADAYFEELETVRDRYGERLKILGGIEFSEPHVYRREFERLAKLPYDFIIGSVHFWKGDLFPSQMIEAGIPAEACFEAYWREIERAVSYGGFDCVGHLDFPKRYYGELRYEEGIMIEIIGTLVRNGLLLEINTSTLRKGMTTVMPDEELLALYRRCGGRDVTVGSDAHCCEDLGAGRARAEEILRTQGLSEAVFEKRRRIRTAR